MRFHRLKLAILLLGVAAARGEILTTVDGRQIEGTLASIDGREIRIAGKGGQQRLTLAEVRSVVFEKREAPDLMSLAGQHVAIAEDGSRIALKNESIADSKIVTTGGFAPKLSIPLDGIARILRPRAHEKPLDLEKQREAMKLVRGDKDTLLVSSAPGEWVVVNGALNGLAGDKVQLNYEGTDSAMDAATIPLIELAKLPGRADPPKAAGQLVCTDGSQIAFTALEVRGKQLSITCAAIPNLSIDPGQVAAIRFQGARMIYLSDLRPSSARQTPFFDETFAWRKDQCVTGTPLRLDGLSYEKGLGLHARCEISFNLDGAYKALTAVAGIDDSAPAGAAVLRIAGDDKPLLPDTPLESGKPPLKIRLDLSGVKTLTISADFAPGTFGAGARVDLCDTALAK